MSSLDSTFAAIADPTRRALLFHLATRDATVTDLAKPFAISLPAVSKHIGVLENAGLVERKKKGRVHHCRLLANPMKEAAVWINFYSRFWAEKPDVLERYLDPKGAARPKKTRTLHSGLRARSSRRV